MDNADTADRVLHDSVAQGLVRFDATGQIEPGIAERWIVTDEGTTYIFRLREMTWSDGKPMLAQEVVSALRRQIGPRSRNPLAPHLTAVVSIVEMTPQVIQIELSWPRPDLLKLFAQPEMAIVRTKSPIGSGPMRIVGQPGRVTRLAPVQPTENKDELSQAAGLEDEVLLVTERAAAGVARFAAGRSDLFVGGTIAEWPLLAAAGVLPANIRLDPAAGLFGLAITNREGFLGDVDNRSAVALAIDRTALTNNVSADWPAAEDVLPPALDSAAPPAKAPWSLIAPADRRVTAIERVAAWRDEHGAPPELRIAVPAGPGGTLLWARLAADLYAIGIRPIRADISEKADLRLVDAVAPYDSARWYLANACQPCGEAATAAIDAGRTAPTLTERAAAMAVADAALAADVAFIPLARPLRWSLVTPRLRAWQPNPRAWHPLNRLRRDTR